MFALQFAKPVEGNGHRYDKFADTLEKLGTNHITNYKENEFWREKA